MKAHIGARSCHWCAGSSMTSQSAVKHIFRTVISIPALLAVACTATSALGQVVTPDVNGIVHDQANRNAQQESEERAARQGAPQVIEPNSRQVLGPFPVEKPCFGIEHTVVSGSDNAKLKWLSGAADTYKGYCIGPKGLNYILKDLQGQIINRGYVLTRIGVPENPLRESTLFLRVVPGVVSAVQGSSARAIREFKFAWPQSVGDIYQLEAADQATEQMLRIPGRKFHADVAPGPAVGNSIINAQVEEAPLLSAALSVNDFAGHTVGSWQGSGTLTAQDGRHQAHAGSHGSSDGGVSTRT